MLKTVEHKRLESYRTKHSKWKKWGPYLSERAWGTVRENKSDQCDPWKSLTYEDAQARAYCILMLRISFHLSFEEPVYQDIATKFFEHFYGGFFCSSSAVNPTPSRSSPMRSGSATICLKGPNKQNQKPLRREKENEGKNSQ